LEGDNFDHVAARGFIENAMNCGWSGTTSVVGGARIDVRYGDGGRPRNDLVKNVSSDVDADEPNRPISNTVKKEGIAIAPGDDSEAQGKVVPYGELVLGYVDQASEILSLLVSTVICLGLLHACDIPFLLI
jgi:hypothetical protein